MPTQTKDKRVIINEEVNFPLCLAPMVGLSHRPMRRLLRSYMPKGHKTIWPTEMLNSRRLPGQKLGQTPETLRLEDESFLVPQILGNQERYIAPSVEKLIEWGADAIDINMGCPVDKALRHNYGVALMGDADYAAKVVEMTVRNSTVPVSVKLRAGMTKDPEYLLNFVSGLKDAGASWICLHPRTASEKRKGKADWEQIKFLRDRVDIPVIGNGDVQCLQDLLEMREQTECDSVMVGRALSARPWLFWQLANHLGLEMSQELANRKCPTTPEEEAKEMGLCLVKLLDYCVEDFGESMGLRKFRFYIKTSILWLNFGHSVWAGVNKNKTPDSIRDFLLKFFENDSLKMALRTNLRQ